MAGLLARFESLKACSATGCTRVWSMSISPIPRATARCARSDRQPLNSQLANRRARNCPYVFRADIGDGHFTAAKRCLARLCATAKIEGVTPHTLRHNFGSVAGDLGFFPS
jgi:integrase